MNYREAMAKPEEGSYYLMTLRTSEDRGGSDKATGLIVAPSIEELRKLKRSGTLWHARNGALFNVGTADGSERRAALPLVTAARQVVEKTFNPEATGWWEEDDEEEVDLDRKHYVVVSSSEDWQTHAVKHDVQITQSWPRAMGALVAQDHGTVSVYLIDKGEARLVGSTAPVTVPHRELDDGTWEVDDLAQYRTGFSQYDFSINPYEGCSFACKYCYAGVYKDYADLPQDLWRGRLVIGTHTDPYQPREAESRSTRELLLKIRSYHEMINPGAITKVGIFTRGRLIEGDLDLIKQLPNPVIHFDLSPFPERARARLENSDTNADRLPTLHRIKEAGIRLILNVCPCVPKLSEEVLDSDLFHHAYKLADEICVGMLMTYGDIPQRLRPALPIESLSALESGGWEDKFLAACDKALSPYYADKLVIWRDRTRKGWKRMQDRTQLPQEFYLQ